MAVSVSCPACGHTLKIPGGVYERRVAGQIAILKCKRCNGGMSVDGTVSPPRVKKADTGSTAKAKPDNARTTEARPPAPAPEEAKPDAPEEAKPDAPEEAKPDAPEEALLPARKPEGTEPANLPSTAAAPTTDVDSSWSMAPSAAQPDTAKTATPRTQPDTAKTATPRTQPDTAKTATPRTQPDTAKTATPRTQPDTAKTATAKTATAKTTSDTAKTAFAKTTSAKTTFAKTTSDTAKTAFAKTTSNTAKTAFAKTTSDTAKTKEAHPADLHWLVSYDDDDDRNMNAAAIARELRRGAITKDTIVWREGMREWLPLAEVTDLARIAEVAAHMKRPPLRRPPPPRTTEQAKPDRPLSKPRRVSPSTPDPPSPFPGDADALGSGGAHRTTDAGNNDEHEIVTSVRPEMLANLEIPSPVLPAGSAPSAPIPPRASGPGDAPLPRPTDLASPGNDLLSGLSAAQPTGHRAEPEPAPEPPSTRRRGPLMFGLLAGIGAIIAVAAVIVLRNNHETPTSPSATPSVTTKVFTAPPALATAPVRTATAPEAGSTPSAAHANDGEPAAKTPATGSSATGGDFFQQFAAAAHRSSQPFPAGGGFDPRHALTALDGPIRNAAACRQRGDPTGTATIRVTFNPSGKVARARVGGPLAGTPTARCIITRVSAARVPPFSGSPAAVTRSVVIR